MHINSTIYKNIKPTERVRAKNYLVVLASCLVVFYSLFFPALESPDEVEHLSRVLYEKTLWGEVTHYIGSFFFDISSLSFIHEVVINDNFSYANNNFLYLPVNTPITYYALRLMNTLIVLVFFFFIVKIFNGNKLVLLWPSATYYMSLFNSEALAYALMLGSSTNTKFKMFLLLCISVIMFFLDRSIAVFVVFLLIKFMIMTLSRGDLILFKKYSIYFFSISLVIYIASLINFELIINFIPLVEVSRISQYSHSLNPSSLNQILIFIASFIILSGSMSFYPTTIFYIYMLYLLFTAFKFVSSKKEENPEINDFLSTVFIGLSVFLLVSSIAPQLSHFRYYLFLVPPIVSIFIYRYPAKYLFTLTLFLLMYNTLGLNLLMIYKGAI